METPHPVSTVSASLSTSFSAIFKGAMETGCQNDGFSLATIRETQKSHPTNDENCYTLENVGPLVLSESLIRGPVAGTKKMWSLRLEYEYTLGY